MRTTAYAGTTGGWGRMAVLLAAMAVGLFGVLLLASGPARAHDHQLPDTVLRHGPKEGDQGAAGGHQGLRVQLESVLRRRPVREPERLLPDALPRDR